MKFKKDRYTRARKGNSKLFEISCSKCGSKILTYQKDGIGSLQRLYFDRISECEIKDTQKLKCSKCSNLIGVFMIYKPESREAFRLIRGSFSKKEKRP